MKEGERAQKDWLQAAGSLQIRRCLAFAKIIKRLPRHMTTSFHEAASYSVLLSTSNQGKSCRTLSYKRRKVLFDLNNEGLATNVYSFDLFVTNYCQVWR